MKSLNQSCTQIVGSDSTAQQVILIETREAAILQTMTAVSVMQPYYNYTVFPRQFRRLPFRQGAAELIRRATKSFHIPMACGCVHPTNTRNIAVFGAGAPGIVAARRISPQWHAAAGLLGSGTIQGHVGTRAGRQGDVDSAEACGQRSLWYAPISDFLKPLPRI
jgi:hypothetical protein